MRRRGYARPIAMLVAVLIIAAYFQQYGFHLPHHWPRWTSSTTIQTHTPRSLSQRVLAKAKPADPATDEGRNCLQKQSALLKETRKERLDKMHAEISGWVTHHKITAAEASVIEQYLERHPDGDGTTSSNGVVQVLWGVKIERGLVHLAYDQKCICREWATIKLPPPPPPPARPVLPVHLPPPIRLGQSSCFAYPVDGRGYLVKMPLELEVSFYNYDDGSSLHKLMADPCFYAEDGATHERLRLDRECVACAVQGAQQAIWPADVQIGTETEYKFSVYSANGTRLGFPSGYGTVYVPSWFMASSLWCFTAIDEYRGHAPAWDTRHQLWRYMGYYDLVTIAELKPDLQLKSRRFHRALKPVGVFGQDQ